MKTQRYTLLVGLICSASVHAANWQATQLTYQPDGWGTGIVTGINNLGQVIGILQPPYFEPGGGFVDSVAMPFVTGPNGQNLKPIYSNYEPYVEHCAGGCHPVVTPWAINDAGQIVMTDYLPSWPDLKVSLVGPNGGNIPLPLTDFIIATRMSLNSSGQVAGSLTTPAQSFITDANGSNPQPLAMLDTTYEHRLYGINDQSQVLASGVTLGATESTQFVTGPNGNSIAFEVSLPEPGFALGLNNSAQLFGLYIPAAGSFSSFVTGANGAGFTDIGSLGGSTIASAINNLGLIVGSSNERAFVYGFQGSGILDLNQLVSLRPGEFLIDAPDINDRGQIIAMSNLGFMYLLTPVPEPATYAMMLAGLIFIGWKLRGTFHVKQSPALA